MKYPFSQTTIDVCNTRLRRLPICLSYQTPTSYVNMCIIAGTYDSMCLISLAYTLCLTIFVSYLGILPYTSSSERSGIIIISSAVSYPGMDKRHLNNCKKNVT